jgi:hypothetical protein
VSKNFIDVSDGCYSEEEQIDEEEKKRLESNCQKKIKLIKNDQDELHKNLNNSFPDKSTDQQ